MPKNIVILHVFPDDKFFDSTADFYDKLPNVENRYVFFAKERNYQFKYIKKYSRIKIVENVYSYIREFKRRDLNVVFFHTMTGKNYVFVRFVRSNVKVIWWSWGFDIYMGRNHTNPLINIPLYKPLTLELKKKNKNRQITLYKKIKAIIIEWLREGAVKRVDYFIPSIPVDYDLMKEHCPFFRAKPFPYGMERQAYSFQYREKLGNILVGNSLTYTNNHLDIFEELYNIEIEENRHIVVPVSYGGDYRSADNLISLTHFPKDRMIWLKEFLSRDRYFEIFNNITHAIFGVMRQQGMGNILYCLRTGVKVYLYKDSTISRQLKELGYIFYTIEEHLNFSSLSNCLSRDDARHNYNIFMSRYDHCQLEDLHGLIDNIMLGKY